MVEIGSSRLSPPGNRISSVLGQRPRFSLPATEAPPRTPRDAEKQRLVNDIASELWSRLPIARIADEAGQPGIEQIVRFANTSHSQIVAWHDELRHWTTAICHAAIEIRGSQVSTEFIDQLTRDITDTSLDSELFSLPPRPIVDFKFADLSPKLAMQRAVPAFENLCLSVANEVFDLLDRLQEQKLVGSLQNGDSTCQFTFYRRVAILEASEKRQFDRHRGRVDGTFLQRSASIVDTVESANVAIEYRTTKHTHHVHRPVLNPIDNTQHPLPQQYQELILSCPDWLRPSLRVLEGDLIREQQLEWETSRENRLDEQVLLTRRIVDSPAWAMDPAVVFADYVLAGWGEPAIIDEHKRLSRQELVAQNQETLRLGNQYRIVAWLTAILAVGLMSLCLWATPLTATLAIVVGITATLIATASAHCRLKSTDRFSTLGVLSQGVAFGGFVFAAQSFIFAVLQQSLIACLLGVALTLIALITNGMAHDDGEWS